MSSERKKNYFFRLSEEQLKTAKLGKNSLDFDSLRRFNKIMLVFDAYDDDFDGEIKIEYLGDVLRAMGVLITERELKALIEEVDPERKKILSLGSYFIILARQLRDSEVLLRQSKSAMYKLYVDKRIAKKSSITDPSSVEQQVIPLSFLRSMMVTSTLGEVIPESDMVVLTNKIERAKLLDPRGNVNVDGLVQLLTQSVSDVKKDLASLKI